MIALLVAMLVPSLRRSVQLANSTVCKHNMRAIGHGLMMYRMDHSGWLPVDTAPKEMLEEETETASTTSEGASDVWFLKLFPSYLADLGVLICPEDPYGYRMMEAQDGVHSHEVADCPSYGMSSFIMNGRGGALAHIDRLQIRAEATILVGDLGPDHASASEAGGQGHGPSRNQSLLTWDDGFDPIPGSGEPWLTARHGEGINILTVLGSVRAARTIEMMRSPILNYYYDCALGNCTLCNELGLTHYSFAKDQLYWWIGPAP